MRARLLCVVGLAVTMPAMAGNWDPNYIWDSGKTLYEGNTYTRIVDWGDPEYQESIYRESSGTYASPKVPDRLGRFDDQYGGMMDWTGPTGGKIKWRFDHSPEGHRVPPNGHTPDYSPGVPSSIALGLKVLSGTEMVDYTYVESAGGNVVSSFVADDSGYPRIITGGETGKMELRWYNTVQNVAGVESNWKPNSATVAGITGNWLMPANEWATVQLIFGNDEAKTWEAYLVREGFAVGHMWGTYNGSPSNSCQFGFTSTVANAGVVYDYLAFGWGADNIGVIPEPATFLLLALAWPMVWVRRRR
ncbi:MAG TPA: hypothetical protein PL151_21090 [Phycisphaerae bacterium]|nr:hypothetical protein [Phycisphaerae bacterium]HOJ75217.1 hypothetical protein [Phycisphaerae bacterium]HOM52432.1 hypothetical protein [Phycisphaerae bacterium]HOQ85920.1 hypothetical protein [Phycisphaerae bacterium]HPP27706.1 hypothetical protein [Phycisphaerae bacterium]